MTIKVSVREYELIIKALNKMGTESCDNLIDKLEEKRKEQER